MKWFLPRLHHSRHQPPSSSSTTASPHRHVWPFMQAFCSKVDNLPGRVATTLRPSALAPLTSFLRREGNQSTSFSQICYESSNRDNVVKAIIKRPPASKMWRSSRSTQRRQRCCFGHQPCRAPTPRCGRAKASHPSACRRSRGFVNDLCVYYP
ncbi:hypothetical protein IQ06DRAFT_57118 [Phaeosphaeriaceae sp. SRC1lsM3a]|nr:hypothetical protein IQ06DRAFT_57118 [Stagonospora sp. SRC1lsM3a]